MSSWTIVPEAKLQLRQQRQPDHNVLRTCCATHTTRHRDTETRRQRDKKTLRHTSGSEPSHALSSHPLARARCRFRLPPMPPPVGQLAVGQDGQLEGRNGAGEGGRSGSRQGEEKKMGNGEAKRRGEEWKERRERVCGAVPGPLRSALMETSLSRTRSTIRVRPISDPERVALSRTSSIIRVRPIGDPEASSMPQLSGLCWSASVSCVRVCAPRAADCTAARHLL
eukprot:3674354-Rhodomonas_salina.2